MSMIITFNLDYHKSKLSSECSTLERFGSYPKMEFTFTLPQGSCHQFSEPSVSPDRAWLLIAHCYQTVAPDIKKSGFYLSVVYLCYCF